MGQEGGDAMGSRSAFIVGTGLGYVLGTRAGRQRFEKIKGVTLRAWNSPQVQERVHELEGKAADFARSEATALKGRVTENLKSAVSSARGGTPTRPDRPVPGGPHGRDRGRRRREHRVGGAVHDAAHEPLERHRHRLTRPDGDSRPGGTDGPHPAPRREVPGASA